MNGHIKVEYNEQYNFNKVTCIEGHLITNWDGNDIKSYTACTIMYTPSNITIDEYYCITEDEHNKLMNEQVALIEKENAERELERYNINIISGTTF